MKIEITRVLFRKKPWTLYFTDSAIRYEVSGYRNLFCIRWLGVELMIEW